MSVCQSICNRSPYYERLPDVEKRACVKVTEAFFSTVALLLIILGSLAVAEHSSFVGLGCIAGGVFIGVGVLLVIVISAAQVREAKVTRSSTYHSLPIIEEVEN
jgi:hypothetical protein